jgi:hypothetical protein
MKRRAFKLFVFVLAGAIINVAVAWGGAAYRGKSYLTAIGSRVKENRIYYGKVFEGRARSRIWLTQGAEASTPPASINEALKATPRSGFILDWDRLPAWCFWHDPVGQIAAPERWNSIDCAFGWPCLGLRFRIVGDANLHKTSQIDSRWGIDLAPSSLTAFPVGTVYVHHALPLRPLWPGFAINTIFYGALVWALFALPFLIRRKLRIKRGLCPACAYPVGTNESCTECGAAVR